VRRTSYCPLLALTVRRPSYPWLTAFDCPPNTFLYLVSLQLPPPDDLSIPVRLIIICPTYYNALSGHDTADPLVHTSTYYNCHFRTHLPYIRSIVLHSPIHTPSQSSEKTSFLLVLQVSSPGLQRCIPDHYSSQIYALIPLWLLLPMLSPEVSAAACGRF